MVHRPFQTPLLGALDRSVERHPCHEPGMGEVPLVTSYLPETVVGSVPDRFETLENELLQVPDRVPVIHPHLPGGVQRVHQLPVDIDLELCVRRVADPNRPRALVTGQPTELDLRETTFPAQPVHDLEVLGVAGDRPHQPVPPRHSLPPMAGDHQRLQGEGGIAEPDESVVPVTAPAEGLGERGGRGSDDGARRVIGERLEGHQRPVDCLLPLALVAVGVGPLDPPLLRVLQALLGIDQWWLGSMGLMPGHHEGEALAGGHGELGHRGQVLTVGLDRGADGQRIGPGDREQVIFLSGHPWHQVPVVESHRQLHPHRNPAPHPFHDSHHVGVVAPVPAPDRHQVEQPHLPPVDVELGLEDQGSGPVLPPGGRDLAPGSDPPPSVALVTEQGRQTCAGVEPGEAEPVDRTVPGHEGCRLGVTDQRVVLDRLAHRPLLRRSARPTQEAVRVVLRRRCSTRGGSGTCRPRRR